MFKQISFFAVGLLFLTSLKAEASWKDVYTEVSSAYVEEISVEDLAIAALKGLNRLDSNLVVANDQNYVTLYYHGKVAQALRKPKDKKDAKAWADLTEKIIQAATEHSTRASEKDFQIQARLAESMTSVLDQDSKYYGSYDDAIGLKKRNHRVFSAVMEGSKLVITIKAFNKQTEEELKKALSQFHAAEVIIIDLRGCPGGMSGAAVKAADLFLREGVIVSTQGKNNTEDVFYTAHATIDDDKRLLFLFIDGQTASAAEIFVSALQEQGRARVIGTQSKGKGTLQKLISLAEGGVLAVTNSYFKTPSGKMLHHKGVTPDVCTFEQSDSANIEDLLEKKRGACAQEPRENSLLEKEVAQFLIDSLLPPIHEK